MSYPLTFVAFCTTLKIKLTSSRKDVLYILWNAKKPLKAYEILDNLLTIKSNSKPPTVYRALLFFLEKGIVHKIESIQSYTLCTEPEKQLPTEVLMVCNQCHHVVEIYDRNMRDLVAKIANNNQFNLKQDAIELKGLCKECIKIQPNH
jgi:Fur family transcriptional regulator, zinc uptake regulator